MPIVKTKTSKTYNFIFSWERTEYWANATSKSKDFHGLFIEFGYMRKDVIPLLNHLDPAFKSKVMFFVWQQHKHTNIDLDNI